MREQYYYLLASATRLLTQINKSWHRFFYCLRNFLDVIQKEDFRNFTTEKLERKYKEEEERTMDKLMQMQEFSDELILMHFRYLRHLYDEIQRRKENQVQ